MAPTISEKCVGVADQEGQWLSLWSVVLYCNISVAVVEVFKEGGVKVVRVELGGELRFFCYQPCDASRGPWHTLPVFFS